jgi:hypothetical protein
MCFKYIDHNLKGLSRQFEFGQKVVWLEIEKIGEEPLVVTKFFLLCLQFIIKFNKIAVLCRHQQNISEICRDTVGKKPRGYLCF